MQAAFTSASDTQTLDELYKAIGFTVIQWGQAEQSLDFLVLTIFHDYGGAKKLSKNKKIPVMLKPKLEYLENCLSQLSELASLKEEGLALVASFTRLSQKRHDLIHSTVTTLTPVDDAFTFRKLDSMSDGVPSAREFKFKLTEFPTWKKELMSLGANSADYAHKVFDQIN
jgi:hypothetical protein